MPSPFPGMDPFLEDQGYWKELHTKYLNGMGAIPKSGDPMWGVG
jgi:hypothetical protein